MLKKSTLSLLIVSAQIALSLAVWTNTSGVSGIPLARAEDRSAAGAAPSLEEIFTQALKEVRGEVATPVEVEQHRTLINSLLPYLYSADKNEQHQAAVSLRQIATADDLDRLIAEIPKSSVNPSAEIQLLGVLGKIGDARVLPAQVKEFDLSKRDVQLAIVDVMGQIPDDSTVTLLSRLLRATLDPEYLQHTLAALAKIGGARAAYAIESAYSVLPDGAPKVAARWSLDIAKRQVDLNHVDVEFKEGMRSLLFYKGTMYYLYRPTSKTKDAPDPWLLVCMHGSSLNAEELFNTCFPLAKQYKIALLVPFFDPVFFPEYQNFNIRGQRSDQRLLELLDFVGAKAKIKVRETYFFGVEKGGEFVQRFTLVHPERVARSAFLTPQFLSLSTAEFYPFGLRTSPEAPDISVDFQRVIKSDFAIMGDSIILSSKPFKAFYGGLSDYAEKNQMTSRVRFRRIDAAQNTLDTQWMVAQKYLFPPE